MGSLTKRQPAILVQLIFLTMVLSPFPQVALAHAPADTGGLTRIEEKDLETLCRTDNTCTIWDSVIQGPMLARLLTRKIAKLTIMHSFIERKVAVEDQDIPPAVNFTDVTFDGPVTLQGVTFLNEVRCEGCWFKDPVDFGPSPEDVPRDGKTGYHSDLTRTLARGKGSRFMQNVTLTVDLDGRGEFSGIVAERNFIVDTGRLGGEDNVYFDAATFRGDAAFQDLNVLQTLYFRGTTFNGALEVDTVHVGGDLSFSPGRRCMPPEEPSCTWFKGPATLTNLTVDRTLSFRYGAASCDQTKHALFNKTLDLGGTTYHGINVCWPRLRPLMPMGAEFDDGPYIQLWRTFTDVGQYNSADSVWHAYRWAKRGAERDPWRWLEGPVIGGLLGDGVDVRPMLIFAALVWGLGVWVFTLGTSPGLRRWRRLLQGAYLSTVTFLPVSNPTMPQPAADRRPRWYVTIEGIAGVVTLGFFFAVIVRILFRLP